MYLDLNTSYKDKMRKYIAEFIGTAVLVFFGCGSAVAANALFSAMGMGLPVAFTTLLIAFAFGLGIMAMYYAIGNVSGCHVNPAVSFAMVISKRMSIKDFIGYIIGQVAGGIAGAALIALIVGGRTSLGANGYGDLSTFGISMGIAFLIEVILTFVIVFVVLSVTAKEENKTIGGLVIGLAYTFVHLFGVPFTGTSVNPARSIGPALLQGGDALTQVWVFIAAPLVGALVATAIYLFLNMEPKEKVALIEGEVEDAEAEAIEVEVEDAEAEAIEVEVEDAEAEETPEIEPSTR